MLFSMLLSALVIILQEDIWFEVKITKNYWYYFRAKKNVDSLAEKIEYTFFHQRKLAAYCDSRGCYSLVAENIISDIERLCTVSVQGKFHDANVSIRIVYRLNYVKQGKNYILNRIDKICWQEN